jgi:nucleoside 2-deoxyribosyltransferase
MSDGTSSTIQVDILQEVKTPLKYFALAVLVVNGILGVLAYKASGWDFTFLLVGMIASLFLLIALVGYLAARKPGALVEVEKQGVPKLSIKYDLFLASPMAAFGNDEEYQRDRDNVLKIINAFKQEARFESVVYAGTEIKSVKDFDAADLSVNQDFQKLVESKYFVLLYPKKIASSVLVEAGWALALGKPSVYFVDNYDDLPFLLQKASQAFSSVRTYDKCDTDIIIKLIKRHRADLFSSRAPEPPRA